MKPHALNRWYRLGASGLLLSSLSASYAASERPYRYHAVGAPDFRAHGRRPGRRRSVPVDDTQGGRGTAAYNPYIYFSGPGRKTSATAARHWVGGAALGLSSVETLVVPSRAAAEAPFVNEVVARADAVFIAGGDQSNYIRYWKGTKLDQTLY